MGLKLKGLNNLRPSGIYHARKVVPKDVRAIIGRKEWDESLFTKDRDEAIRLGVPLLSGWASQIEAARAKLGAGSAPVERSPVDRDRAYLAIKRWESARVKEALNLAFNGSLEKAPVGFSDEMRAHVQRVGDLENGDWSSVPDFDALLSDALNSQRVACDPQHPAIPAMRPWFAASLANAEKTIMNYRRGHLTDAPEAPVPMTMATIEPPALPPIAAKATGMKLMAVFDLWEKSKGRSEKRHRGYVQRLVEYLGDPDIADVTPLHMDAFLGELRKFPNTKKPVDDVPFAELIERAQKWPDYRTLHVKTVWNWTVVYKGLFEFALDRDLVRKNPAAKMMRKPAADESDDRLPYDAEDIDAIFSAPLFNGFDGTGRGYRDQPGFNTVKDHKYWLPILALWTGARVEELATLDKDEIKTEGGVHYIDLTERPLKGARRVKNRSARRMIPLHDKLVALGFMQHVASASGPIFPELDRDGAKASASFTKWWGRWCDAHAKQDGREGLGDPAKVFHSFRHAWKAAARRPEIQEQFSDMISGHEGGNGVARGYGRAGGIDVKILKETMDIIEFPTFHL